MGQSSETSAQTTPPPYSWRAAHIGLSALILALPLSACASGSSSSNSAQELVDRSTLSVETMLGNGSSQANQATQFLRRAKAVVVCPRIFKAGFFIGGEGGDCVLVSRAATGSWSAPAFYTMGSGSFGLQIGVQDAEVIMMLMNDTALNAFLNSQFKIGADAGISVATIGAGVGGSTGTALGADIITFAKSRGLYGGISLSGSVFSNDAAFDQQYYGRMIDPRQIVVTMSANNAGANPLRAMLAKFGG
ncbi:MULTISPECIES: lipid-binding SYLF domain-containing protein [Acidiphilium]|uniref:Lipid-binding SYLF domain-containing protein n=1 Tax=Acidiphilium rubrum TaxID=526 RepID=A0A8G2FLI3_ACIRU|nr:MULTISPECIES: lipid-binding SYLF domain-containing protein [Acidiphilium]SIR04276.1 Lipid-binding SYLF domain-containing protein [Acidiphilium rubrum]